MELEGGAEVDELDLLDVTLFFIHLYQDVIGFDIGMNDAESAQDIESLCNFDN